MMCKHYLGGSRFRNKTSETQNNKITTSLCNSLPRKQIQYYAMCWRTPTLNIKLQESFWSHRELQCTRIYCTEIMNTHTQPFLALWILSGTIQVSRYPKKHSSTHIYCNHPLSASSIHYNPRHPLCSIYMPDSVFPQSTSWPGTLHFILHTFLHPIVLFFSQHMPIPSQIVLL